jgi:GMP reductase
MRIDNEIKLDFSDVLIRPKRSTLTSRKDVLLERTFTFLHSPKKWTGIPIITANMATSGTLEMAKTLSKHKIITALHKFYTVEELEEFFKEYNNPDYIAYTLGIRDEDIEKLRKVKEKKLTRKIQLHSSRCSKCLP